jgi:hypothetical protein
MAVDVVTLADQLERQQGKSRTDRSKGGIVSAARIAMERDDLRAALLAAYEGMYPEWCEGRKRWRVHHEAEATRRAKNVLHPDRHAALAVLTPYEFKKARKAAARKCGER